MRELWEKRVNELVGNYSAATFAVVLAFGPGYAMGWALRVPARLRVFMRRC